MPVATETVTAASVAGPLVGGWLFLTVTVGKNRAIGTSNGNAAHFTGDPTGGDRDQFKKVWLLWERDSWREGKLPSKRQAEQVLQQEGPSHKGVSAQDRKNTHSIVKVCRAKVQALWFVLLMQ